jgi:hypothetical protein
MNSQRREVMGKAAALMMSLVSLPALAVAKEEQLTLYQDTEDKYAILIPQGKHQENYIVESSFFLILEC